MVSKYCIRAETAARYEMRDVAHAVSHPHLTRSNDSRFLPSLISAVPRRLQVSFVLASRARDAEAFDQDRVRGLARDKTLQRDRS
jgi:hypothetical protein